MILYRYKEKDYAEKIIKCGFQTRFIVHELKILGKYYKSKGYKPKERKELIKGFASKYIKGYNEVKWFRTINSVLNHVSNKDNMLIQIDEIHITEKEIKFINELDLEYKYKKVLFCLLVESKLNVAQFEIRNEGKTCSGLFFGNEKGLQYKILKDVANLYGDIHRDYIRPLVELGLIETINRGKIILTFIKDIPESKDTEIKINTFDNVGNYFDYYNGDEKIIKCESCGKLIKKTANNRKYCGECQVEKHKEAKRKSWHKNKHKN